MPLLIIAGMPTSVTNRNKNYTLHVDNWNIQLIPSRDSKKPDLKSCWSEVLAKASEDTQGTHVFAYHSREYEYPRFNSEMRNRHRLVWMAPDTLKHFGSDMYTEWIERLLDFECEWRDMLRPRGVDAPGLLPESSFSPKRHGDMWTRMRSVCLNKDDLCRVSMLSRGFREAHYSKGRWEDKRGLHFRVASDRHGADPPYGHIKFTYRLPEGFHFDVRGNTTKRGFTVKNAKGHSCQFRKYTNIDVHGSIRGGQ